MRRRGEDALGCCRSVYQRDACRYIQDALISISLWPPLSAIVILHFCTSDLATFCCASQWRHQAVKTGRSLQVTMSSRQVSGHSMQPCILSLLTRSLSQGDIQGVKFSTRSFDLIDLKRRGLAPPLVQASPVCHKLACTSRRSTGSVECVRQPKNST